MAGPEHAPEFVEGLFEALAAISETLLVVTTIPEQGEELFRMAVELELEGLVAKARFMYLAPATHDLRKLRRIGAVPAERFRHLAKR